MAKYNMAVVDVGVASNRYPAVTRGQIAEYHAGTTHPNGGPSPIKVYLNACGSTYGQPMNSWLGNGSGGGARPAVINSICAGPPDDDSEGHYIYYYRDHLNKTDPAKSESCFRLK